MSAHAAELSSLATALEELARRVVSMADDYAGQRREDVAGDLYAVERLLINATRRLSKVVSAESGTGRRPGRG